MRVVVTGAAGFIGSHVLDLLVDGGHEVVAVDNLDPVGHRGPPRWVRSDVVWHWKDVRDPATWDLVLDAADAICHQAAKVGLGVDFGDTAGYVSNNDLGTATMLTAMHRHHFEGPLVLASSMVIYGEGRYDCESHGPVRAPVRTIEDLDRGEYEPRCPECASPLKPALVSEDAPADPRNVYAATKLQQELLAANWSRASGQAATSLRYHNVYGPRMPRDTPYAGVMSMFASRIAAGEAPLVFEDGQQRRDFVHVHDVARANVLALCAERHYDGALNIASGRPCTLLEAATALTDAYNQSSVRSGATIEPEVVGGYRLGDVRHVMADPTRAEQMIGFRAQITPDEGLARFASDPLRDSPE